MLLVFQLEDCCQAIRAEQILTSVFQHNNKSKLELTDAFF